MINSGGAVVVRLSGAAQSDDLTLKVRALVSKMGSMVGHAPLTVLVNDRTVTSHLRIPGGGDLPQWLTFSVPGDWLSGENTLDCAVPATPARCSASTRYCWSRSGTATRRNGPLLPTPRSGI
jgi:hypothetical protein